VSISRRTFLEATGLSSLAAEHLAAAGAKLPTRILAKTGVQVSILAFGGGSRFLQYDDDTAVEGVNKALDLGVTYIDTAQQYGSGLSEQRMGKTVEGRRDQVFLATKIADRDGAQTERRVEASLEALRTDQLDLIHIHTLLDAADLTAIEAKGGVLEKVLELRDQKITRFIGITCHYDPEVLKTALERHDFDCTQMALNARLVRMEQSKTVLNKAKATNFEKVALPVAVRKRMGIIAMKVMGQEYSGRPSRKSCSTTPSLCRYPPLQLECPNSHTLMITSAWQKLSSHCSRKRCESFLQHFRNGQKWRCFRSCAITWTASRTFSNLQCDSR
jgi:uncharacterized protein